MCSEEILLNEFVSDWLIPPFGSEYLNREKFPAKSVVKFVQYVQSYFCYKRDT